MSRWEGGWLLAYYLAYLTYLILDVTNSGLQRTFGGAMIGFVIPLTIVAVFVSLIRSLRR